MLNVSRSDIYDYLYELFYGYVTENVYEMKPPVALTESDAENGFLVTYVGDIIDMSEFPEQTYGEVRCFVTACIPQDERGRVNHEIYAQFETDINKVIDDASEYHTDGVYHVEKESIISSDGIEETDADNSYFTFIKSFIVNIQSNEN